MLMADASSAVRRDYSARVHGYNMSCVRRAVGRGLCELVQEGTRMYVRVSRGIDFFQN
jgi:hypothetical protein